MGPEALAARLTAPIPTTDEDTEPEKECDDEGDGPALHTDPRGVGMLVVTEVKDCRGPESK